LPQRQVYGSLRFSLYPWVCRVGTMALQNRQNCRGRWCRRCQKRSLHRWISSACQSTSGSRIASGCFQLELRANLYFQISTAGCLPVPQIGASVRDSPETYASNSFQPCKPMGEVTTLMSDTRGHRQGHCGSACQQIFLSLRCPKKECPKSPFPLPPPRFSGLRGTSITSIRSDGTDGEGHLAVGEWGPVARMQCGR